MTIALDTPAQINMWVLLSRRSQIKMHLKGYKVAGLMTWCKKNIPGCENARTVKDCVVPVEYAIQEANGPADYSLVNVHVLNKGMQGMFLDRGVFPDMEAVEAVPAFVKAYGEGRLEIVLTMEDVRPENGEYFVAG